MNMQTVAAQTRSQRFSQAAFPCVCGRKKKYNNKQFKEFTTFAKKFPALVHTCGLAQAVAFAQAKKEHDYLDDLATVLRAAGHAGIEDRANLQAEINGCELSTYLRLSRDALHAAEWLKRYVEALGGEK